MYISINNFPPPFPKTHQDPILGALEQNNTLSNTVYLSAEFYRLSSCKDLILCSKTLAHKYILAPIM